MPAPKTNNYEPKKEYFTISEVQLILDETESTLRYWEKSLGLYVKRNNRKHRRFTPQEINTLTLFKHLLRVELYTIPGALKMIGEMDKALIIDSIDVEEKEILDSQSIPVSLPVNHTFTYPTLQPSEIKYLKGTK